MLKSLRAVDKINLTLRQQFQILRHTVSSKLNSEDDNYVMINDEKDDYVMKNEKESQNEVKEVKIKDKMEEKDKILVKKHKMKNYEEIVDEKPQSQSSNI